MDILEERRLRGKKPRLEIIINCCNPSFTWLSPLQWGKPFNKGSICHFISLVFLMCTNFGLQLNLCFD